MLPANSEQDTRAATEPRTDVDRDTIRAILAAPLDPAFAADMADAEAPQDDDSPE